MNGYFDLCFSQFSDLKEFDLEKDIVNIDLSDSSFLCTIVLNIGGENFNFYNQPYFYFIRSFYWAISSSMLFNTKSSFLIHNEGIRWIFTYLENEKFNLQLEIGRKIYCSEIVDLKSLVTGSNVVLERIVRELSKIHSLNDVIKCLRTNICPNFEHIELR
jgi:glycosylphosphatidylinositol transamidase (GPIT) subunit GPI8